MVKKIFLFGVILFLLYSFFSIILGYFNPFGGENNLGTHSYYLQMLGTGQNWRMIIWNMILAAVPVSYLVFAKEKKFKTVFRIMFFALAVFNVISISLKGDFLSSGFIMVFLNTFIIFFLMVYFLLGLLSLGTYITGKFFKMSASNLFEIFMNLGIGLSVFLLVNFVLMATTMFFSIISWVMFLGFAFLIYTQRKQLADYEIILMKSFDSLGNIKNKVNFNTIFPILLIVFSFMYFYFGFINAYIPYPTAWDANHAYMFLPKIRAYNHGIDWTGTGLQDSLNLWSAYIGFWFNLFWPMENSFWISPDTIAIELNFFSGALVLFFGLALIKEVIDSLSLFTKSVNNTQEIAEGENGKNMIFNIGWFLLLLWLTSGMGAFLVFVDNKTDLGIMALIVLAIYSGFVALKKIFENESKVSGFMKYYNILISGFLFAIAIMSKPTSFLDAFNFGLMLFWIWIGLIGAIGIFALIIGGLAFIKFRGISDYIGSKAGAIVSVPGILFFAYDFVKGFIGKKREYIRYMAMWFVGLLATLLVFKGTYLLGYMTIVQKSFTPKNYVQSLLFGKLDKVFGNKVYALEQTGAVATGNVATTGNQVLSTQDNNTCSLGSVGVTSSGDLYKTTTKVQDTSYAEDVGRYVGYGSRTFTGAWWGFLFPGDNHCYGFDQSAIILCQNAGAFVDVSKLDLAKIKQIFDSMPKDSKGYSLLDGMLKKIDYKTDTKITEDIQTKLVSDVQSIQDFYKDNVISTSVEKSESSNAYAKAISIPYKYLVFFNITFNWSLQNQSSYYTDIGFVWLILIFLNIIGLIYAIFKKNKFLLVMQGISAVAWTIWFFIGGGILWYGMGIVIWTILGFLTFLYYLFSQKDELERTLFNIFVYAFIIVGIWQILLNFVRISTQGASGPFSWYRQSMGKVQDYRIADGALNSDPVEKFPYTSDDLFNIQFGHYKKFLELANNRKSNEGIVLAGTYARYFIKDQSNLSYDQFLVEFNQLINDNNPCASYLRIKDKGIKYITIDPNIGTVVMGGGNQTLFDRFFAKINTVSGKVEGYGAFLMLGEMYSRGYLNYISTNNLAIKYAFTLPNKKIEEFMGKNLTYQDLGMFRAKLALMRFWNDKDMYASFVLQNLKERMTSLDFIGDLADVSGKNIDEAKVKSAVTDYLVKGKNMQDILPGLGADEKYVFFNFLSLYQTMSKDSKSFEQMMTNFIAQTVSSGSQTMSLEVKY